MVSRWLDIGDDGGAQRRSRELWFSPRADDGADEFWAERIKACRGEPAKRLSLAMENLPLPAAFREAAIAVRALIRPKRKAKQPFGEELSLLYWLAAARSFMLDYAQRLQEPGFNVVEAIPGKRIGAIPIDYHELGYRRLELLNKTDVKWLVETWGEPANHSTLNEMCRDLWDEYESKLIARREESRQKFQAEVQELLAHEQPSEQPRPKTRSGCLGLVALLGAGLTPAAALLVT